MKVTIILPIYNAEKTLVKMLDSIQQQTFRDFEVIMIDDGSTDSSARICDEFVAKDSSFRVIHKMNEGVGVARQLGIDTAQGEFMIHADADDWVEPTMLEEMLDAIGDHDVLITDFYSVTEQTIINKQEPTNCKDNIQLVRDLFTKLHGNCWSKLIRTSIVRKYNLCFFAGINYSEDLLFWVQTFSHNDVRVAYLSKPFYHYYCPRNHSSISNGDNKLIVAMRIRIIEKLEEFLPITVKSDIVNQYKLGIKHGIFEHPTFTKKDYEAIYPEVNHLILKRKNTFVNNILFFSSVHGLYYLATWLYKVKNSMLENYIR